MLNHLTWKEYLEAVTVLLIVYYGWIAYRFYRPELRRLLSFGGRSTEENGLSALQFTAEPGTAITNTSGPETQEDEEQDSMFADTEAFIAAVKQCMSSHTEMPAPNFLLPQLKAIFLSYNNLKDSHYRPALNELVVNECEKNGAAALTEAEVDQWWDA